MLAIFGIMFRVSCDATEEQKDHLTIKETVSLILLRNEEPEKVIHN